ncbi:hypothetical protein [Frondihabitans peucedani]|uniref:Uridine kinase n=1 Tax=Frondihabitans peucedani TaxID=598626 RepID=A0ABP8DYG5_9MICO
MSTWAPEKNDTVRALATEILHNYSRGRAFVAVDGRDAAAAARFADDLAESLRQEGHAAFRASLGGFDESAFRRELVEPFRGGGDATWLPAAPREHGDETARVAGPADAILLVDRSLVGRRGLAGLWNYAVWVESGDAADRSPEERGRSTAVIDNSDPEHPRRLFDDAC